MNTTIKKLDEELKKAICRMGLEDLDWEKEVKLHQITVTTENKHNYYNTFLDYFYQLENYLAENNRTKSVINNFGFASGKDEIRFSKTFDLTNGITFYARLDTDEYGTYYWKIRISKNNKK